MVPIMNEFAQYTKGRVSSMDFPSWWVEAVAQSGPGRELNDNEVDASVECVAAASGSGHVALAL